MADPQDRDNDQNKNPQQDKNKQQPPAGGQRKPEGDNQRDQQAE